MSELELSKYFLSKKVPYVKPLYTIDINNEAAVLDWFRETSYGLQEYFRPLFREQKSNLAHLLGAGVNPNWASPYTQIFANTADIGNVDQQIFINDLYRLAMDQVTTVVAHEITADVLPNSTDYSDKVAANVVKEWLDSMSYTLNIEEWRFKWEMQKKTFGESFCVVMWNPQMGSLHPAAKKYIDEDIDMVDDEGNTISGMNDEPVKLKKNTRIGDIQLLNPMPWDVMIEPKVQVQDSDWFWWVDYLEVDYLKKKYPKLNWDIKTDRGPETQYDVYSNTEKENPNKRKIVYLYHRSCEFMPEGRYIVLTDEHQLVNEPLSMETIIENQDLPIIQYKDFDMGVGNRGIPIMMRNCRNLSECENQVANQMYNNIEMESPKMFVHETSGVDPQRMPNGNTFIEWHGQHKPSIETPQTNTSSIFKFWEEIRKSMDQVALQNPLIKGETPNAQLDSFVSLQYFEDLRNQLANPEIKRHLRCMERLYKLMISIARDKYDPSDQRLIKILGKHNTYQLKYFDPVNLEKSYDVHISTTGNLANSRAARTQMMISIKEKFPKLVADDVFVDVLGISHSKKFMNAITSAVSSAEAENQEMMGGKAVLSPARFEDLIAHWEVHRIPMQTLDFKQAPQEVQALFEGHVAATEKLMFEQAAENPLFGERLGELRQFPMFYTAKPVNEPVPQPGEMEAV